MVKAAHKQCAYIFSFRCYFNVTLCVVFIGAFSRILIGSLQLSSPIKVDHPTVSSIQQHGVSKMDWAQLLALELIIARRIGDNHQAMSPQSITDLLTEVESNVRSLAGFSQHDWGRALKTLAFSFPNKNLDQIIRVLGCYYPYALSVEGIDNQPDFSAVNVSESSHSAHLWYLRFLHFGGKLTSELYATELAMYQVLNESNLDAFNDTAFKCQ